MQNKRWGTSINLSIMSTLLCFILSIRGLVKSFVREELTTFIVKNLMTIELVCLI